MRGSIAIFKISKSKYRNATIFFKTRKHPLRGYFLGVLKHTTAWDQLQGGDETLKCGFKIIYTRLNFVLPGTGIKIA